MKVTVFITFFFSNQTQDKILYEIQKYKEILCKMYDFYHLAQKVW